MIDDEALQRYVELFSRPLSEEHIAAVLALFGWQPPVLPVVETVTGLEGCA